MPEKRGANIVAWIFVIAGLTPAGLHIAAHITPAVSSPSEWIIGVCFGLAIVGAILIDPKHTGDAIVVVVTNAKSLLPWRSGVDPDRRSPPTDPPAPPA